ncbi:predicted protein [Histoplasma capsulatum H143]|uniref:Uncharacterized protein n=1 Tax=Ajellomyces capsulatus (strain H143) TaxID=544712 RepID=C6HKF6_AJECH|nr:predicted protein [Histoplasma capsulatum H143]
MANSGLGIIKAVTAADAGAEPKNMLKTLTAMSLLVRDRDSPEARIVESLPQAVRISRVQKVGDDKLNIDARHIALGAFQSADELSPGRYNQKRSYYEQRRLEGFDLWCMKRRWSSLNGLV